MRNTSIIAAVFLFAAQFCAYAMPTQTGTNLIQDTSGWPKGLSVDPEFEYVFDRSLSNGVDYEALWTGVDLEYRHTEDLTLNLFTGISSFGEINAAPVKESLNATYNMEASPGFAVGGGFKQHWFDRAVLPNHENAQFFFGAQTRYTTFDIDTVQHVHSPSNVIGNDLDVIFFEWAATLGVNQNISVGSWTIPATFGVVYSDVYFDLGGNAIFEVQMPSGNFQAQSARTFDEGADDVFGVFVGTDIEVIKDRFQVGLEGRFIHETSVSVEGKIIF